MTYVRDAYKNTLPLHLNQISCAPRSLKDRMDSSNGYRRLGKANRPGKKSAGMAKKLAKAFHTIFLGGDLSTQHRQNAGDSASFRHTFASNCAAPSLQGIL